MNATPIAKALSELYFTIPREVLELAFLRDQNNWIQQPLSLDEQILSIVIRPRVLVDMNLIGGKEMNIPLFDLTPVYAEYGSLVYRIPKEKTNGRSIVSALSLSYIVGTQNTLYAYPLHTNNEVNVASMRLSDSYSNLNPVTNAELELIAENTVLIKYQYLPGSIGFLRVIVGHDENLNDINPRSIPYFAKLCQYAVKSYIYNHLLIKLDQGYLLGGHELGEIKTIVDSYSDAEELYQTTLREIWSKVAIMNDNETWKRYIKSMIVNNL